MLAINTGAATAGRSLSRTYSGITCTWPSVAVGEAVTCRRANATGLAVIVTRRFVMVSRYRSGKVIFIRNQPDNSSLGFGPLNDKRVFHSETHRGIVCYWSRVAGGTALCNREDRHGYVAGVSRLQALVRNEKSKIVFLRNQP
jgi:hypothetical protein